MNGAEAQYSASGRVRAVQQNRNLRDRPAVPVIQEIAWVSLLLQLLFVSLLILVAALIGFSKPILTGTLTYLVIALVLRLLLTRHHRRGMYLAREYMFDEAIPEFQKSYEFFHRNPWLDWWRYALLLSASQTSYREMALLNMAYCDIWSDRGEDAVRTYLRVVEEFPNSGMAWAAIKLYQCGGHDGERRARSGGPPGAVQPQIASQPQQPVPTQASVRIGQPASIIVTES